MTSRGVHQPVRDGDLISKQPMKMRAFRCGPSWDEALGHAEERGESWAEVLRKAVDRYNKQAERDKLKEHAATD